MNAPPLLYLDFDGVLHGLRPPVFEYAPLLGDLLDRHAPATLRIVLSTSWVPDRGLAACVQRLPDTLARRVIGATFDPERHVMSEFGALTRYRQILQDVAWRQVDRWLAIDDDNYGWTDHFEHMVRTDTRLALGDAEVVQRVEVKFKELYERIKWDNT